MLCRDVEPKLGVFDSVALINRGHWNAVLDDKNIYLSIPYLEAIEHTFSQTIDFRYTIFYCDEFKPIAISYVQILQFEDSLKAYGDTLKNIGNGIKSKLLGSVNARVLVCGNMFATGENGFVNGSLLDDKSAYKMLAKSMKRLTQEKEKNGEISFGLVKEIWPSSVDAANNLKSSKFRDFEIDVNMVLRLREGWQSVNDYLADMTSKYRTRAKSVFKKSEVLFCKKLTVSDIEEHKDKIYDLYLSVVRQAEHKFTQLNAQSFINFKAYLGTKFSLKAYFFDDEMVGFSASFLSEKFHDAAYVGFNYDLNKEYSIYQRMLYDLVDEAIRRSVPELRLGRTAETPKSSIGAEPVAMKLYARHRNDLSNKLIGPLISTISPSEYELRPPFKKELA